MVVHPPLKGRTEEVLQRYTYPKRSSPSPGSTGVAEEGWLFRGEEKIARLSQIRIIRSGVSDFDTWARKYLQARTGALSQWRYHHSPLARWENFCIKFLEKVGDLLDITSVNFYPSKTKHSAGTPCFWCQDARPESGIKSDLFGTKKFVLGDPKKVNFRGSKKVYFRGYKKVYFRGYKKVYLRGSKKAKKKIVKKPKESYCPILYFL